MIQQQNVLIFDIDGSICELPPNCHDYNQAIPFPKIIERIQDLHKNGFYIILCTSRNMRTFEGNIGQINAKTAPTLFNWLEKNQIPYDEIHFGKPWCGKNGFYVDDRAVRPMEFVNMSVEEIRQMLAVEMTKWRNTN